MEMRNFWAESEASIPKEGEIFQTKSKLTVWQTEGKMDLLHQKDRI